MDPVASASCSDGGHASAHPFRTGAYQRRWVAFCIGAAVFIVATVIEWFGQEQGWSHFNMLLASNSGAGLLAGLFVLKIMVHAAERRERMQRNLQAIGDLNHEIRNALEVIQLSARYMEHREAVEQITYSVERIARVLREMDRRSPMN
jgi:signal transduction histidine kinase